MSGPSLEMTTDYNSSNWINWLLINPIHSYGRLAENHIQLSLSVRRYLKEKTGETRDRSWTPGSCNPNRLVPMGLSANITGFVSLIGAKTIQIRSKFMSGRLPGGTYRKVGLTSP